MWQTLWSKMIHMYRRPNLESEGEIISKYLMYEYVHQPPMYY